MAEREEAFLIRKSDLLSRLPQQPAKPLDLDAIRAKLAGSDGPQLWRCLEEFSDDPDVQDYLEREFPEETAPWKSSMDRRQFFKLAAFSLAFAGLAGCRHQSIEKIVPYVRQPEDVTLGETTYYASALTMSGYATGVLIESHQGRPIKIEGNPQHPASLGSTDIWQQAAVMGLYDPDRSKSVSRNGEPAAYDDFLREFRAEIARQAPTGGSGFRILTETVTSPTLAALMRELLEQLPNAVWHQWEPVNRDNARYVNGGAYDTIYNIAAAKVIVSLDSDFLYSGPGHVRYTRDFADGRRVRGDRTEMNRLYAFETVPTTTGAAADHRVAVRAHEVGEVAAAIAERVEPLRGITYGYRADSEAVRRHAALINAIADDLRANAGSSIVVAGDHQPPQVHALADSINAALGNLGSTVLNIVPVEANPVVNIESLRQLAADIDAGQVHSVLILGGNPVYSAPADLRLAERLRRVRMTAHVSTHLDETSAYATWHIPLADELESWGDARAYDGTASIIQPLIEPLMGGRSIIEVAAAILGREPDGLQLVREHWSANGLADDAAWRQALHSGVVPNTVARSSTPATSFADLPAQHPPGDIDVVFRADPTIYDGRFANNPWLQELPKTMTKVTWDNVAAMSPRTAERLGLADQSPGRKGKEFFSKVIEIRRGDATVRAPIWIMPGLADDTIFVTLGYGRTRAGSIGSDIGFNANSIRTSDALWSASDAQISATGDTYQVATTQQHHTMSDRHLVRQTTIGGFIQNPQFASKYDHGPFDLSMYPDRPYEGNKWGMVIDTNVCTGCGVCTIACQAENNIPTVGKTEVLRAREMHWIRVDRYYAGDLDNPQIHHLPVPCMHCEKAPCEVVCPVAATSHSAEGINEQTYNRCVGTRYCSNNCPYKVRRFNFLNYSHNVSTRLPAPASAPILKLVHNPHVTVRGRGIMEKCTYCIQKINSARKHAKKENRPILDGEIVPSCAAACPSQAIVFGNLNDNDSQVAELAGQPHNYGLLTDLNTRPRTTYLAKLRNPNPQLEAAVPSDGHDSH